MNVQSRLRETRTALKDNEKGRRRSDALYLQPHRTNRQNCSLVQTYSAADVGRHVQIFPVVNGGLGLVEAALGNDFQGQGRLPELAQLSAAAIHALRLFEELLPCFMDFAIFLCIKPIFINVLPHFAWYWYHVWS